MAQVSLVRRLAATWRIVLYSSNEPGELLQCSKHDDSTIIAGARVWNDLPSSVVSAPSLAMFKKNLKTHLFQQSYSH